MGIPEEIDTDNGPPFSGIEFKEFCEFLASNIANQHRYGLKLMVK
jgi:hypothetical protein